MNLSVIYSICSLKLINNKNLTYCQIYAESSIDKDKLMSKVELYINLLNCMKVFELYQNLNCTKLLRKNKQNFLLKSLMLYM